MAKIKGSILIKKDIDDILEYLEDKSESMHAHVEENRESSFLMIRKYITHSDLITKGKRSGKEQKLEKNYLYYLSSSEMQEIEKREDEKFESAKQSNIGVPSIFFEKLGIDQLKRRDGQQKDQHQHILINDFAEVYLINDTLDYFNSKYTFDVFDKLSKSIDWNKEECDINLKDGMCTPIELRHAVHGVGTSEDREFHKLRRNIFKNDSVIFLIESRKHQEKKLYILLEKNPRFFTVINKTNAAYERFLMKKGKIKEFTKLEVEEGEKTRKYQSAWREKLAAEMKNFTTSEDNVFCPFTYIEAKFDDVGTLYRASHIKSHAESTTEEAYDINNGLLLVANADALFDKHLISVNEKKELIFSFLIDNDSLLKSKLLLTNPIFKDILNDKRMKYMEEHRKIFFEKEEERKKR